YDMAGAVQHGASTLPADAFGHFVEAEACEVHLATNFQNMFYDRIPDDLRQEMYAYLDQNHSNERKPDMTDEQFYYKTRKRAIGPFKAQAWSLPPEVKTEICNAWEANFSMLFTLLEIHDTKKYVEKTITPLRVPPDLNHYLGLEIQEEDVSDLAY
ncbi:MAG: aldolase, partial [Bacteroidota bacterium]|nr:aldolase [Bacteroidota bacterium]